MSMLARLATTGGAAAQTYVDDVFSTYLYTGNGSTQTITNGIDLAGKGGLVWFKNRDNVINHQIQDTATGTASFLVPNTTSGYTATSTSITSFNSNGFSMGSNNGCNGPGMGNYVSWTFRKAPKFFDCGTYTGNGVDLRQISHALTVAPRMVVIKRTDSASDWQVYHYDGTTSRYLQLNLTNSSAGGPTGGYVWTVSSSTFTLAFNGNFNNVNASGASYVWYAFAHDSSAEGIIQCGSFTTDGSGNATVNLGWEPQYVMRKTSSESGNWFIEDALRGQPVSSTGGSSSGLRLDANTSGAEGGVNNCQPNATGFKIVGDFAGRTYIYLAIRRPNKPPTTGTQVYNAIARTGTGAAATVTGVGFAPDLVFIKDRAGGYEPKYFDRLRGSDRRLYPCYTDAESLDSTGACAFDLSVGIGVAATTNNSGTSYINHFFKRAPGVFDVVCYSGQTGTNRAVQHSLSVAPELVIVKARNFGSGWWMVYSSALGANNYVVLQKTDASAAGAIFPTAPTSTNFYVNSSFNDVNDPAYNYVAYLFATKQGVSKCGSYTGNGGTQTIDCGFTTGARFFLVKATSTTGSWWIFDSVRGVISAADPALQLNSTADEVTSADAVDPASAGIVVNQEATCSINASGVSYVYLALS